MEDVIDYHYAQVAGGLKVDLCEPDYSGLKLMDMAKCMAGIPRFNNATTTPCMLTAHSLNVLVFTQALGGGADAQKWALAHDAHEIFIGDQTRPYHRAILGLLQQDGCDLDPISILKDRHDYALCQWLKWEPEDESLDIVKKADVMACAYEVHAYWYFADDIEWKFPVYPEELPAIGENFVDPDGKFGKILDHDRIVSLHRVLWYELMAGHFPHLKRHNGADRDEKTAKRWSEQR